MMSFCIHLMCLPWQLKIVSCLFSSWSSQSFDWCQLTIYQIVDCLFNTQLIIWFTCSNNSPMIWYCRSRWLEIHFIKALKQLLIVQINSNGFHYLINLSQYLYFNCHNQINQLQSKPKHLSWLAILKSINIKIEKTTTTQSTSTIIVKINQLISN